MLIKEGAKTYKKAQHGCTNNNSTYQRPPSLKTHSDSKIILESEEKKN